MSLWWFWGQFVPFSLGWLKSLDCVGCLPRSVSLLPALTVGRLSVVSLICLGLIYNLKTISHYYGIMLLILQIRRLHL